MQASRKRVYTRIGLVLIICSCLLWLGVFIVPFTRASISTKALMTTCLVVVSEVMFWLGIILAGKELAHRYRRKFNPFQWWKKLR